MAKLRDFLSLEQALIHASKDLTDEDLEKIGKTREDIRRFSDPLALPNSHSARAQAFASLLI